MIKSNTVYIRNSIGTKCYNKEGIEQYKFNRRRNRYYQHLHLFV